MKLEYRGLSKSELREMLISGGVMLNPFAETLLESNEFTVSVGKKLVSLVDVSLKEMGFADGTTLPQIDERANELNLKACALEVAPHLRLKYQSQPVAPVNTASNNAPLGSLTVYSEPVNDDDDFPKGFYLRNIEGVLWLRAYRCSAEHIWSPGDRFIFSIDAL
jgi:hypothetical protein